jgi:hypothetical protein
MDDRGIWLRFPSEARDFLFFIAFRLAVGPIQAPMRSVPEAVSPG